jgi:anti-sigma factor RsiW
MTEITRNVILDLLPLYLAGEVSEDTRALVENYLESDSQLANLAKQSAAMALPEDIPVSLTREDKLEAYKQARRAIRQRTVALAVVIAVALLALLGTVLLVASFLISA